MQTQIATFTTVTKNNIVTNIGKSAIYQPKVVFKGGSIKWHEDKFKTGKGEK